MWYRERVTQRDRIAVADGKRQEFDATTRPLSVVQKWAFGSMASYPNIGKERG
jgi:hypothetical protein